MATDYPEVIYSSRRDVNARLSGDSYVISFPYSRAAVSVARTLLKNPKFDSSTSTWRTNKRWHRQLNSQLDGIATVVDAEESRAASQRKDADKEKQLKDDEGRAAFEAMKPFGGGIKAEIRGKGIVYRTAYHASIVSLFRSLKGHFDSTSREWSFPLSAGTTLAENRENICRWHNEAVDAKQSRAKSAEQRRANRYMTRVASAPAKGAIIQRGSQWYRVDGCGRSFTADEDTSSMGGPIGAEGELVCYVYLADATAEEIEGAMKAREAQEARNRREAERRQAVDTVAGGQAAPNTGKAPEGTTLWSNDGHAATGFRQWIVLHEGWLYHITYDGSDGAAWGDGNVGHNMHATRVRATPALTHALGQD